MPSLQRKRKAYKKKYYKLNQACASRREYNKQYYVQNAQRLKNKARAQYHCSPEKKKAGTRALYKHNPSRARAAFRIYYKKHYATRISSFRKYYVSHKREICLTQKARYVLTPPKPDVKGLYVKEIQGKLLGDAEARSELITAFKKLRGS